MLVLLISYIIYIFWYKKKIKKLKIKFDEEKNKSRRKIDVKSASSITSGNPTDNDSLGYKSVVDSVVKLIKNKNTSLPVNIVLNGVWGRGKTSLMLMIKDKLTKQEENEPTYLSMWFNAWHFQSEKSVLASFLSKMINVFEDFYGFKFRWRIFRHKVSKLKFWDQFQFSFAVFIIFPLALILFWELLNPLLNYLFDVSTLTFNIKIEKIEWKDLNKDLSQILKMGGGITLLLTAIAFFKNKLEPSGIYSIIKLIPKEKFKFEVANESQGFREKYKNEFWEIMDAGKKEKVNLVVFIDDMDRITGSRIKDLLETINFIADTASRPVDDNGYENNICFIMGMSTFEVISNLNKVLAEQNGVNNALPQDTIGAKFLEKMVDVVIPIPEIQENHVSSLTARQKLNGKEKTKN